MAKIENEVQRYVQSYEIKKGTRWRVCIPDGHGNQIREQGFLDKKSAMDFAKETFQRVLFECRQVSTFNHKITFEQYSHQWLIEKGKNGAVDRTVRRYKDMLRLYILPFLGPFQLQDIQKFHLRNLIAELQKNNTSTYNVQSAVTITKMILRQAIEDDYLNNSSVLTVRTPKHSAKQPVFWDVNEFTYFLNANAESKNHKLWRFVLFTGLRASEVGGLKWDCIHWDRRSGPHTGFITVKRTIGQKARTVSERTKNGLQRTIPILPEAKEILKDLRQQSSGDFVFGGEHPIETSHLSRMLANDLRKIPNLRRVTFHGLRHSFCSFVDATGLPRRIVSEIMGHKDINTTNRYSHVSNQTMANEISHWLEKQNQQNSNKISLVAV